MKTILIVDDEPNYLIVLTELLQEEGYDVFTAQCGEEGMKIVKEIDLDLVITDMRMVDMLTKHNCNLYSFSHPALKLKHICCMFK
jgi:DNA-binding response OmpR family regulator